VKFKNAEMHMLLACSVHPWMQANIYSFDHSYHSVTSARGTFQIAGLPPGQYDLVFYHSELGEQSRNITIEAGKTARADATFKR